MRSIFYCTLLLAPSLAFAAQPAAGRLVAERECGGCHAVGLRGESPLSDAPRFRDLRARIDGRTLGGLLTERTLAGHPRMPRPRLDPDERAALVAYWNSLPPPDRASLTIP